MTAILMRASTTSSNSARTFSLTASSTGAWRREKARSCPSTSSLSCALSSASPLIASAAAPLKPLSTLSTGPEPTSPPSTLMSAGPDATAVRSSSQGKAAFHAPFASDPNTHPTTASVSSAPMSSSLDVAKTSCCGAAAQKRAVAAIALARSSAAEQMPTSVSLYLSSKIVVWLKLAAPSFSSVCTATAAAADAPCASATVPWSHSSRSSAVAFERTLLTISCAAAHSSGGAPPPSA
mmetsp:Transcript_8555/g.34802  ORF Transcript_8555/g.34802 Transcript_8555/m.34802 type:complete len:237 (-) Transcript_8555:1565-2275(-)